MLVYKKAQQESPPPFQKISLDTGEMYAEPLSNFEFKHAFEEATTKKGYLFEAAGIVFKLYMRCNINETTKEGTSTTSLFRWDDEKKTFLPAAFLDMSFVSDEKGRLADCMAPVINTVTDTEEIANMDLVRKKHSGYGYWVDPALSKTMGRGGFLLGIGRFLLTMQGEYARSIGINRLSVTTPTDMEYETLLHFFADGDKVNATVRHILNERKLEVDLSGAKFPKPEIKISGLNPLEYHSANAEFIRQLEEMLREKNPNFNIKFSVAGEKWILAVRSQDIKLDEKQRNEFSRIEQVTVNLFHIREYGSPTVAGFIDRINIFPANPEVPARAEMITDPIIGSADWAEITQDLVRIADEFRRNVEPDPVLGFKVPFQVNKNFSRHKGGDFSHVGRFMLSIQDIHSKSRGITELMIAVPNFPDASDYFRDFYKETGAKLKEESGRKYITVNIKDAEFHVLLMRRIKGKITTLDSYAESV